MRTLRRAPYPHPARLPAGILLLVAAAVALAGCGGSRTDSTTKAAPTTAAPAPATSKPAATAAPTTTATEAAVLADGRYPVFVRRVDATRRTLTFDLIQFLTGQAAAKAAAEDHQESPPPNDYYIRNVNPRLRTLPVRPDAPVTVNTLAAEETGSATKDVPVTLAKLAGWFPRQDSPPFWITVRGGRVTGVNEQYVP